MPRAPGHWTSPPDPDLYAAGVGGERLVARSRLAFWVCIGLAPLGATLTAGSETPTEVWVLLLSVCGIIAVSLGLVALLERGLRIGGLGFWTGAFDVTAATVGLAFVALAGRPMVVADSRAAWAVLLLAILATCLRFDPRICLFVGMLAILEYVTLLAWIVHRWELPIETHTPGGAAELSVLIQVARVLLMLAATALATIVVYRSRQLVEASGTDRLTGLGNRATFDQKLTSEISRARRSGSALTLAVVDIDRFKSFNDRWGHEAGDEALQRLAQVLLDESRREDLVSRWGGEEFALVLPGAGSVEARAIVERIRSRWASEPLGPEGVDGSTLSAGIAELDDSTADPASLFAAADGRLFAAKRSGRDRVVATEQSPVAHPRDG